MKKGTGWEQVSYRDVQDANEMRMRETAKCLKNLKSLMQKINREKCDPEGEKDMAEEKKNDDCLVYYVQGWWSNRGIYK